MTYRVKNWGGLYENNRTRELKAMAWVPIPNGHDGDGFCTLLAMPDGPALFGAWVAILQVASKCDVRGTLLRDTGKPHDAVSIARMTRFPVEIIQSALCALVSEEVGWLEVVENCEVAQIPQEGAGFPQEGAAMSQGGAQGKEGNGTEKKEGECARAAGGDVVAVGCGGGDVPTLEQVVASVMANGIPEAFTALVYQDWLDMGGTNSKGVEVPCSALKGHLCKRWRYEQGDWRSGKHRGLSAVGKVKGPRFGPSRAEVEEYARTKGTEAVVYAPVWFRFWEGKGWRTGYPPRAFDWQVMFSKMFANQRKSTTRQ